MTKLNGLSLSQVEEKKSLGQANLYQQSTSRSYWNIISQNVFNFVNLILFALGLLLIAVGRYSDSLVYVGVVLLNSLIGTIQELRAKNKLDKIALLTKPKTIVVRDSMESEIDASEIVLDDIIKLSSGDMIPVDGKIIEGDLQVDESLLTGESDTINKTQSDLVSSGTFITSGSAYVLVTKVGTNTLAYEITLGARSYRQSLTPLQKEVNLSVRILIVIALLFASLVIINAIFSKIPFIDSLPITAVVAGIIPNSLFVMINLAYAIGGVVLIRKGALAQELNAIESLSNVDMLCVDKTGTLTTNKIVLEKIIPLDTDEKELDLILSNFISHTENLNSTLKALEKYKKVDPNSNLKIIERVNFSSQYKWSGFSFESQKLQGTYIIGAPEIIIDSEILKRSEFYPTLLDAQGKGFRVLILSVSKQVLPLHNQKKVSLPDELKPIALILLKNELRPDVSHTLAKFKDAGVDIKIISGDNLDTVVALAKQAGLYHNNTKILSGSDMTKMEDSQLSQIIPETSIFGRITPKQKETIITELRNHGHYVAMIGDGVNDALSLKKANLGIAMESGSQVTRNIADILLLKDSFDSLPTGLLEGQRIRNAVENVFGLYFARVIYLLLIMVAISMINLPFPFTIKQNSLISILTTGIPALWLTAFATTRKPTKKRLTLSSLGFIGPASITLAIFAILLYIGYGYYKYLGFIHVHTEFDSPDMVLKALLHFVPEMRTVLTSFLIISGLILSIFIAAPTKLLSYNDNASGDWSSAIFSISTILVFLLSLINPGFREFWELSRLSISDFCIVIFGSLIWATILKLTWRHKWINKILGI
jgi:cation-transporting ATPase E